MKRFVFLALALLAARPDHAVAQVRISGTVIEADTGEPLPGVNAVVWAPADSVRNWGGASDLAGRFAVSVPRAGAYRVRFTFVGFRSLEMDVSAPAGGSDLGRIRLEAAQVRMGDVLVEEVQERVVIKGDTTEFNADAYKVNQQATTEDLLRKLPGVTVENGTVQAQGEDVRRVLVDGREFFEGDPTAALRNLPADIVQSIQVFDRLSDQDQFTGFESGDTEKTINIITRTGNANGQFGKVYGGYGNEDRYVGGGNVNVFNNDRRISIIGLSNNINQQNFAMQDILGVVGNAGRRGGGGFGGMTRGGGGGGGDRRGGGGGGGDRNFGGMSSMRADPRNFVVGDQGGVNTTNSLGINYTDQWSPKVRATLSYFFNSSDNTSDVGLDREYLVSGDATQFYNESNSASSENYNHRVSGRIQADLDDRNSLIFTPRISFQQNNATSLLDGVNNLDNGDFLSRTVNDFVSDNSGYSGTSSLLLRHRFDKPGRTVSANLSVGLNDRSGSSDMLAVNTFAGLTPGVTIEDIIDQQTRDESNSTTWSANLAFTEPVGENGQLQVNYTPSIANSDSDRRAFEPNTADGEYDILDPTLSNTYANRTVTQRAGASYRVNRPGSQFSVGLNVQNENLSGNNIFPIEASVDHSFFSLLPSVNIRIGRSRQQSVNLFYRTNTNTPSVSQLQDVVDNTNPLRLSSGNPALRPSYSHTFVGRWNRTDPAGGRVMMGLVSVQRSLSPIGTETIVALDDTEVAPGVVLQQGSQFNRPINLDQGSWSARSFFTLGMPSELLKSNVNISAGYTWSSTPSLINGFSNLTDNHSVNGGVVFGSNISQRLDFTTSYNLSWTTSSNSVYPELNNDYTQHRGSFRLNWMPIGNWVVDTSLNASYYGGLGADYDSSVFLLNAGLGYRFLKGNGGELKLIVADILNQNDSIIRTINELYIEDQRSNLLGRYVLLNFTYTIRNFRV